MPDEMVDGNDPISEDVESALNAAFSSTEEEVEPVEQVEPTAQVDEVEPDQPEEESFTGLDPNTLPENVKPFYNSMLADYRRKTQEVAETRKAYEQLEQFGGPEVAMEAINFAYRLETDPQFALNVHSQLSSALQAQGLTAAQASAEATNRISEAAQPDAEEWEEGDEPWAEQESYVDPRVDQLQGELNQLKQVLASQQLQDNIAMQENVIQKEHPDWKQIDWDTTYQLAHYTKGDLMAAASHYDELKNKILADYLSQKGTITGGAPEPVPTGTPGEEPTGFDKLSDPRIESALQKMIERYGS